MNSAFPGSDCVGRIVVGRFTLLRWLGGTDQSSVFLTELEGDPAQKAVIKLSPANSADVEARMAQWATSSLSHPHVMRLLYAGRCEVDGVELLYLVTEYADEILSEILRERPLTPGETREMLDPVLEALSWLHGRGLVHGQLRPSKIMVVGDRLKLSIDRLHAVGEPGRPSAWSNIYDAPEAALETMSPAMDVWSLGVVLVEALTQQQPLWDRFGGGEPVVPASIPPPFFDLARECLRVNPAARLTLCGVQDSLAAGSTAEPADPASRALPSRVRVMIAGAVLVVVGIIIAGVIRSVGASHRRPEPPAVQQSFPPASRPQSPDPGTQPHEGSTGGSAVGSVVKGAVASRATPVVPQSIRNTIQGHVRVRIGVEVDSDGNVAGATIDSPGPSRYLASRALTAAREWKFRPAEVNGRAAASKWILQFRFGPEGITISPTETSP